MDSPARSGRRTGGSLRTPSRSPAKTGADDLAAGLSEKMGDLLLTDKEAAGLVIKGIDSGSVPRPRWAAVGKVCSPRRLVIGALDRALQRAWGLHGPAQFKDIGDNRFVVRFSSEGDWKHAMKNGPWQFDFHVLLLKEYDGSIRPSDMVFDTMDIWVRVLDLPMDMMNRAYGELIGGWIGKYISVDVDTEGMAWGEELRIRVAIRVDQPLLRGVTLRESEEVVDDRWFDIKYEKIPHFCFACGLLVHQENKCLAEKEEAKQWGEWLRASPKKNKKQPPVSRPSVSSGSYNNRSFGSEDRNGGNVYVRNIPPGRIIQNDFSYSSSSFTGGYEQSRNGKEVSRPDMQMHEGGGGSVFRGSEDSRFKSGTYTRRARQMTNTNVHDRLEPPMDGRSKKRGSKQVWLPVGVSVAGEENSEMAGKRQRTASVFDRIEEPSADPAVRGHREQ
uniref:Uncharacterized protein n=1 Tax=Avena sativa TaxID=4498 RepID=A0ACD5ZRN2_AVESA